MKMFNASYSKSLLFKKLLKKLKAPFKRSLPRGPFKINAKGYTKRLLCDIILVINLNLILVCFFLAIILVSKLFKGGPDLLW
jgi:lipopolysaccharide/colanic/teichoic acid biosynthesis glycosyltransferase